MPKNAGCCLSRRLWAVPHRVYHEAADNLRLVMDNTLPPSLTPVTGRQQPFESECPFIAPLLCIVCRHARHKLQPLLQQA